MNQIVCFLVATTVGRAGSAKGKKLAVAAGKLLFKFGRGVSLVFKDELLDRHERIYGVGNSAVGRHGVGISCAALEETALLGNAIFGEKCSYRCKANFGALIYVPVNVIHKIILCILQTKHKGFIKRFKICRGVKIFIHASNKDL